MGRRVDRFERAFGFQVHLDTYVSDGRRRESLRVERQHKTDEAAFGLEEFGVAEGDAFSAVGFDREYAHLEDIPPDVLEQGRVAQFPHDVLVNPARLLCRKQLRLDLAPVDFHCKGINVRALGKREDKGPFQPRGVGIAKLLVHRRDGHLVGDAGVDFDETDRQRGKRVGPPHGHGPGRPGWRRRARRIRPRPPMRFINQDHPGPHCGPCAPEQSNQNRQPNPVFHITVRRSPGDNAPAAQKKRQKII